MKLSPELIGLHDLTPNLAELSDEALVDFLQQANEAYRSGSPIIPDDHYDNIYIAELARRVPDHPFLHNVEPEPAQGKTVRLPHRMLSTNKAYSLKEIEKWANDVTKVAYELGLPEPLFRVTPKLDGFAAYDEGKSLFTRGDGYSGTDITRAVARGIMPGTRGRGPGEIVVKKGYFADFLADKFENSRNIIAAVIKEGEPEPDIIDAILHEAVQFVPFSSLNGWSRYKDTLLDELENLWESNLKTCEFDTDGLVIEAVDQQIKEAMGSTNHHHRWQIAYKKNAEYHDIRVTGIVWQTSKNGRLTPVVQLEPTKVSGVTISKATGHHAGNVIAQSIGEGATVKVCRSGLVIPYIESVVEPASVTLPESCPSCNSATELDGDNLMCTNTETCPAQIEGRIEFFFKTLGNCDGFGPKAIEQICKAGVTSIVEICTKWDLPAFADAGFGEKTGRNLYNELIACGSREIEDWRFLAAFSLHGIGKGMCERLLKHHTLADVFSLSAEDLIKIDGFADKTAASLVASLARIKPEFDAIRPLFNLTETPRSGSIKSPIAGKTVVFTGTLSTPRADMEKTAKALGAKVGSSVSSKTNYLICGANVGSNKTQAAEKHGVTVLDEAGYLAMIGGCYG